MAVVRLLFSRTDAFTSICPIVREDESSGYLEPTYTQRILLKAFHEHRWNMVTKYRQAKITTISVLLMLRDCMYLEGVKGLLIAERHETAKDVFERILYTYDRLDPSIKMPLASGRRRGATELHFHGGGNIKILSTGGKSPGIGRSPDRLVITEFGESQWQAEAAANIFPALYKRDHARIILESTPGRFGTHHHNMWKDALAGRGRFNPVFLKWWHDETCEMDATGFRPEQSERALLEKLDDLSLRNLAFRRDTLYTGFGGDERLLSSKYPNGPYDGWIGSVSPLMPIDVLEPLFESSVKDPEEGVWGVREIEPPEPSGTYLIVADPAGFGAKRGDPSAITVFDAVSRREVAFWEDRENPDRFAMRLRRVQDRYNGAMIAVESNAAACITILKDRNTPNLLWTDRNHPGWYATHQRIQEAEARLVQMLRDNEITLRSRSLLHQLLNYNGTTTRRVRGSDGSMHHFDRARTAIMAAHILSTRAFTPTNLAEQKKVPRHVPGQVTISQLDRFHRGPRRSMFRPASSYE